MRDLREISKGVQRTIGQPPDSTNSTPGMSRQRPVSPAISLFRRRFSAAAAAEAG
jgi:hypothetical protein